MKRLSAYICMVSLLICLLFSGCKSPSAAAHITRDDSSVTVSSPSSTARFLLTVNGQQLCCSVRRGDKVFLEESPLGIQVDGILYGALSSFDAVGDIQGELRTDTRRLYGKTAVADDPCVAVQIPVQGEHPFTLEVRVFDNGAAFRYRLLGEGDRTLQKESTAFILPAGCSVYAGQAHIYYESTIDCYDPTQATDDMLGTPATVKLADGGYAAIMEGDLQDYPGMKLAWSGPNAYQAALDTASCTLSGDIVTPWRIISIGDDLNELVNNTIVYQVCDEAQGDYSWVTPGKATWSWITGRTSDRVTPALMEEYTRHAARLGFTYNIIDEGWVNWSNYNKKLPELAALGESYGVGQILWTGVTTGASFRGGIKSTEDAVAFLNMLDNYGMAGGKIDYFTTENHVNMGVNLYRDILALAAEKELVVNFHGCNKPTGLDATYPNELNREAILGLESTQAFNRLTQTQMFVSQPFVRGLAGHADYTPAAEDAFQMAQLVLTDAPMQAIGSDPAELLASPALEMIKSVPTVWQETVVLPQSDIAKSAVIARKASSGSWFVGGINQSGEEKLTLDLSLFLGEGTYQYELWLDGDDGLEKTVATVTQNDTLTVPFGAYTGFIIRFDRVTLSQYGGEIDPDTPLTVRIHDPHTKIAYTLDGSEPGRFAKTLKDGDTLTLTDSCVLTLKITSGKDKGLVETYRFNRIE